jgi:hypothetical protein
VVGVLLWSGSFTHADDGDVLNVVVARHVPCLDGGLSGVGFVLQV